MDIHHKNILITGGANGIGKALTTKLAKEQTNIGIFDINESALKTIKTSHPNIRTYVCDVSDEKQVEKNVNQFFTDFGSIDVLVNNAGIVKDSALLKLFSEQRKHDIETWHKIIQTNLTSVFLMTRCVADIMVQKRTKGLIINVSSVAANGNPGQSAYAASKAGINALTKTWANELNFLGIRVAGIAPGFTNTHITESSMNEKLREEWIKKTPLKRFAEPEEIADGIIFIIKNDFFHGKILELDGGLVIN